MDKNQIVILFEQERETKRTIRFAETAVQINGKSAVSPASGTLYLQKWAIDQAFPDGVPSAVTVTVQIHHKEA